MVALLANLGLVCWLTVFLESRKRKPDMQASRLVRYVTQGRYGQEARRSVGERFHAVGVGEGVVAGGLGSLSLPAAPSPGLLPRKKRTSERGGIHSAFGFGLGTGDEKARATDVLDALRRNQVQRAWTVYKNLMQNYTNNTLITSDGYTNYKDNLADPAIVHSRMLSALVQHLVPSLAVVHAEMIVLNFKTLRIPLSLADYNNLMAVYLRNNDLRSLKESFDSLFQNTYPPVRARVSALSQPPPSLRDQPLATHPRPLSPNLRSFHLLMSGLANAGRVADTKAVLEQLHAMHPAAAVSDPQGWALLMTAYAYSPTRGTDDLNAVQTILDRFSDPSDAALGAFTDRRILDAGVRGLGACGDFAGAKSLFRVYESRYGVREYGLESIDALMHVYEVHGDVAGGEGLLEQFFDIRRRDPGLGDVANSSSAPKLASIPSTLTLPALHQRTFPMPLLSTIKSLMRMHLAAGNSARVLDLYENVLTVTQLPDAEAAEIVVRCYLADGRVTEAQRAFEGMMERGYRVERELVEDLERAKESAKYS
ncbi:hypothetical protein BC830DRAFT_339791 [Chytriomyces sp. MP71]|nr:hypothetical protein BC830DRAFT_339791 [Chytriomyces sp. MP71]